MRLLAYIGRFFHGSARQPGLLTVSEYASARLASRTDKGVNAVANPGIVPEIRSDFVLSRGEASGRPKRKEYRYFLPKEVARLFEEFLALIPNKIDARAFTPRPRKRRQTFYVATGEDYVSFASSGFETYAIRRLLGYFIRRSRGVMGEKEILEARRGTVRRYPPLAPPEGLALRSTDVEIDDGNRRRIERRIASRCRFRSGRKRHIRGSKLLIKREGG